MRKILLALVLGLAWFGQSNAMDCLVEGSVLVMDVDDDLGDVVPVEYRRACKRCASAFAHLHQAITLHKHFGLSLGGGTSHSHLLGSLAALRKKFFGSASRFVPTLELLTSISVDYERLAGKLERAIKASPERKQQQQRIRHRVGKRVF